MGTHTKTQVRPHNIWAVVKTQFEGIHCWPEAGQVHPQVAFLENPHRHIFHVEVHVSQRPRDRDVEYILLGREVRRFIFEEFPNSNGTVFLGRQSCEDVAMAIGNHILETFPGRHIKVGVSEDGENGCLLEWGVGEWFEGHKDHE